MIGKGFIRFRDIIERMPPIKSLTKEQLLTEDLLMERIEPLDIYYAPHNEVIMEHAKLMIVGLTPGFHQMKLALAEAQAAILEGDSDEQACMRAKQTARFAGVMRVNLITMLDQLGIDNWLGLNSCEDLFAQHAYWLNSTSVIPYPAFLHGRNYTGSQPHLLKHKMLTAYAKLHMHDQLEKVPSIPVIPLGKQVEGLLRLLVEDQVIDQQRILWGFPHPSGANGHRLRQFAEHLPSMSRQVTEWANQS
ncbi:hypothetical protein ACFP56_15625 [Paenibacillus septentrionalis]|uniref:Uracil-DNA glycosylase-like domain-containing protein n=1 Tax=Paenibacillus septentrionalis TaxID=429342 RepID=A0ABW1V5I8_9BACL